jgi:threonyl-tRNA synthetase
MNDSKEPIENIRHSLAHLLAASVIELYPGAQNAIGPAIENGFYQDLDIPVAVSEKDLPKIEKKMRELLKTWKGFERREVSEQEALKIYDWNKYKQEMVRELAKEGKTITTYTSGSFVDLCRGGHAEDIAQIKPDAFKLTKVAGAYWRGDQNLQQLTRIYGVAFHTKQELDAFLKQQEEAEKRDHKKLGKELGLFVFSEAVGKGLPLLTPKGSVVRRELERFIVDEELKRGYLHVYTPDIARLELYKKSGHYPYYKDSMYAPIKIEGEEFMLRPMTCPHHFELYLSGKHSYRELPMRIAELAQNYRFEQSGELMGLLRVRTFCLADAHIIARKSQAGQEIHAVLDLIDFVCKTLGLELGVDYRYRLSLGDRSDNTKYFKDDKSWDDAENTLRSALQKRNAPFYEAEKEAAFYGPKIDIQMKNVSGKEDTAFTVQYDFVMPKRFELSYVNEEGAEEQPIVIHRSSIGALERVMAFLIERYAGAFPLWLSPVQVKVMPIGEKQAGYAREVLEQLKGAVPGLRAEIDDRDESIGKRIREASKEKVSYLAIVGEKEVGSGQVAVRGRNDKDLGALGIDKFADLLKDEILHKEL